MRTLIALSLVVAMALLGAPVSLLAQSAQAARPGAVSGEALDAGGRALVNQRVELVQTTQVVQTTTTGTRGEWTFSHVAPGDYVVRTLLANGQTAGVRVSVAPGQTVANTLIVSPSAAVPSAAFIANLDPALRVLVIAIIAAAIGGTIYVLTKS